MDSPDKQVQFQKNASLESLNKASEALLEEIYVNSRSSDNPMIRTSNTLAPFSSLLVNLAKQSEESAKQTIMLTEKTMKYTRQLIYLTWAIVFLTVVLIYQGFK